MNILNEAGSLYFNEVNEAFEQISIVVKFYGGIETITFIFEGSVGISCLVDRLKTSPTVWKYFNCSLILKNRRIINC